jgi:methylated-DNA-[protein]-cysteine S-methyltransferase
MTSNYLPELRDPFEAFPGVTEAELRRLHDRLADSADAQGILDVAYRTLGTPVGTLLLATTETGLVRVAYETEGHDSDGAVGAYLGGPAVKQTLLRLEAA